jgi:hypothetical protein
MQSRGDGSGPARSDAALASPSQKNALSYIRATIGVDTRVYARYNPCGFWRESYACDGGLSGTLSSSIPADCHESWVPGTRNASVDRELAGRGFSVEQHDWNIEFLADYLIDLRNLRALLESRAREVSIPREALKFPRMFLDLLFERSVMEKGSVYNGEVSGDFSEFLAVNRAKYSLCLGFPDREVRARLAFAWGDRSAPPEAETWTSSVDDLVRALVHFSLNYANFFGDFLEGVQELWLTPRSYRLEDVLAFVCEGTGFEEFLSRKLCDLLARGPPRVLGCSLYTMGRLRCVLRASSNRWTDPFRWCSGVLGAGWPAVYSRPSRSSSMM